ncbi:TPA: hypothetical protein ACLEB8_004797 [Pseudomonas aeruginosa]
MTKELNDLLVTAAADYRARGDMATAARFEAFCSTQQQPSEVLEQPFPTSELELPEVVLRAIPQVKCLQRMGRLQSYDVEEVYPACEILKGGAELMTVTQHERICSAHMDVAHSRNVALQQAQADARRYKAERDSSQVRAAELQADLDRSAEGADIIRGLIASIEKKGNYTAESTINFLSQALGCFNRFG